MKKLLFTLLLLISSSANAQFNGMWFEESLAQSKPLMSQEEFHAKCAQDQSWCEGYIVGVTMANQYAYTMRDTGNFTEFSSAVCIPDRAAFFADVPALARAISKDTRPTDFSVLRVKGYVRGSYDCIHNGHKNLWTIR